MIQLSYCDRLPFAYGNSSSGHLHYLVDDSFLLLHSIQLFHTFPCISQNYNPRGAVDDPMNCCPRPFASGNSSSGHPQHRGGDNLTAAQKGLK